MQMFGQGYLVVQLAVRDGVPQLAPLYIGLVGLARAVPGLAFGLFGGVVADRADRRRLLLVTQSLAGLFAAVLAGLTIDGRIDIVQVILLGALNSLVFAFDAPTRQSMVPRLVPDRDLMSAIGLNSAAFNGPQIIGPVLGGLIAAAISGNDASDLRGVGWLFALNAISYLATVTALVLMSPMPVEGGRGVPVIRSIREGLGYMGRDPVIRWVMILLAVSAMFSRPYIQLLPAVANDTFHVGALELSWMLGASGVGSLLGAVATASLGGIRRRGLVLLASCAIVGALVVVFGALGSFVATLPVLTLVGFGTMLFLGLANTIAQTRSPDHLRGRVMSVYSMMQQSLIPLGTMMLGALGTFTGVSASLVVGGVVVMVVSLYAVVRVPTLRDATPQARHRRRGQVHPARREIRGGGSAD